MNLLYRAGYTLALVLALYPRRIPMAELIRGKQVEFMGTLWDTDHNEIFAFSLQQRYAGRQRSFV